MSITDDLSGRWQSAVARFQVHPDWTVKPADGGRFEATTESRSVQLQTDSAGKLATSTYHPAFEVSLPMSVVEAEFSGPIHTTRIGMISK